MSTPHLPFGGIRTLSSGVLFEVNDRMTTATFL